MRPQAGVGKLKHAHHCNSRACNGGADFRLPLPSCARMHKAEPYATYGFSGVNFRAAELMQ